MASSEFDRIAAHGFFSVDCFNRTWGLLDQPDRTSKEDEQMLQLTMASLWHWTQREDVTETNLSVGLWQVSRVHAVLGRAAEARRYGELALDAAKRGKSDAFTVGYAYEALARAEKVAGNPEKAAEWLERAHAEAQKVVDEEAKTWLTDDLRAIEAI